MIFVIVLLYLILFLAIAERVAALITGYAETLLLALHALIFARRQLVTSIKRGSPRVPLSMQGQIIASLHFPAYVLVGWPLTDGIFQYECMPLAATPP